MQLTRELFHMWDTANMEATARVGREILENCCEREQNRFLAGPGERLWAAVLTELRDHPRVLVGVLLGVAFHAAGQAGLALAAGLLGRSLVRDAGYALAGTPWLLIGFFGLAAAFVKASAATFLAFAEGRASGQVAERARKAAVQRLLGGGLHDAAPRVLATIAVQIRELEAAVSGGVLAGARAMAQLALLALTLIVLSRPLAIGAGIGIVPFALGLAALRRRWARSNDLSQQLVVDLHQGVDELVKSLDLWRCYGAGTRIGGVIDDAGRRATRARERVEAARAALSGGNEVLGALAVLVALVLAGALGVDLGDGTVVAFCTVLFMAYRPLRDLGDARATYARGRSALDALVRVLPPAPELDAQERGRPASSHRLERLDLIAFGAARHGARTTLSVAPGELVCVVGPTGSGKTTLLRALLGLEAASGRVQYGGEALLRDGVGPSFRPFAWVPQDALLVTGTVLANVALLGGDESSALSALRRVGADRLAEELAHVVVGPGGRPLSGGERRQVAIARALCSELPVLLLDEPTEGLDADAQRRVLDALERVRGVRSAIVVTHRPELAARADRVIELV
jgi:ABC-type multidrug transport system fused ATPase/permease subunit